VVKCHHQKCKRYGLAIIFTFCRGGGGGAHFGFPVQTILPVTQRVSICRGKGVADVSENYEVIGIEQRA
jgi:hypothetical protein